MYEPTLPNILISIVLTSFWILGFYKCFDEGMIFYRIAKFFRKAIANELDWILKPLFDCTICMSSIHGIFAFNFFFGLYSFAVIPFIVMVAGLNWILVSITE